ncbi:MAG: phosphatase PAP2 family protein [Dongiaceae bacterium]
MDPRGWLTVALVAVAVPLLIRYGDPTITELLESADGPVIAAYRALTVLGSSLVYLPPLAAAALACTLLARRAAPRRRALLLRHASRVTFVFAAIAVSGIVVDIVKVLVGRSRPRLLEDGIYAFKPMAFSSVYQSFPSGHTATLFAAACAAGFLFPRWRWPLLALAALLAATRLAVGAHYPSDVLAGATIAILVTLALRRLWSRQGWVFRRGEDGAYARRGRQRR